MNAISKEGGKPDASNADDSDKSSSHGHTGREGDGDLGRPANRISSLGTAPVEAFVSEMRRLFRQYINRRPKEYMKRRPSKISYILFPHGNHSISTYS